MPHQAWTRPPSCEPGAHQHRFQHVFGHNSVLKKEEVFLSEPRTKPRPVSRPTRAFLDIGSVLTPFLAGQGVPRCDGSLFSGGYSPSSRMSLLSR
ncbi:hypothetical protein Y1Q_0000240 [Alligator mississippiensis]|uniref:Uncharacterized protein n=1 Tax=Alligator mississippiensis TaxID=8496 RepID=A0A151P096_ALLMI|nr:hypothetical protein Y1Q_0000240 [Alligator mississippiensis]